MNVSDINAIDHRTPSNGTSANDMFRDRWSPRAMSGKPLSDADMKTLIEAARWAPSCFNAQPWRFAYALAGTPAFDGVLATLADANQAWAQHAGALLAVISRTRYERNDKPAPTHSFDAGAAWMSLAFQATHMNLATHGMQGFDQQSAREIFKVPDIYDLPAVIAIGHPGEISALPEDYRDREQPSPRKSLDDILFRDNFGGVS